MSRGLHYSPQGSHGQDLHNCHFRSGVLPHTILIYATICPFSSFPSPNVSHQMYSLKALGPKCTEQISKFVETIVYATLNSKFCFLFKLNTAIYSKENAGYEDVLHGERTIFIKEPTSMERKWGFPRGNRRWISLQRGARISAAGQISLDLHFNPTSRRTTPNPPLFRTIFFFGNIFMYRKKHLGKFFFFGYFYLSIIIFLISLRAGMFCLYISLANAACRSNPGRLMNREHRSTGRGGHFSLCIL